MTLILIMSVFDIHDYDDDTDQDTGDGTDDDTDDDANDGADDDIDDGGRRNRRPLPGGAEFISYQYIIRIVKHI